MVGWGPDFASQGTVRPPASPGGLVMFGRAGNSAQEGNQFIPPGHPAQPPALRSIAAYHVPSNTSTTVIPKPSRSATSLQLAHLVQTSESSNGTEHLEDEPVPRGNRGAGPWDEATNCRRTSRCSQHQIMVFESQGSLKFNGPRHGSHKRARPMDSG
ncbi:hypothetical protein CMUS01_09266 [Colletotrichum musicola]|uniref:Uncharacterized protein n=1 Tax=Colletotrichum musicola TaxID=2175873 RepID=A0A8H6K8G8_9PEZI|nr:hypothetical protein CMUS01_09266 [Colletotrichum musicola]